MLPDIEAFDVCTSKAAITVGATTFPNCAVIHMPPRFVMGSELSIGAHLSSVVDNQPRIDVRKDQVPALPVGSTIAGSMDGGPSRTYRVNRVESHDPQYHHAWVSTV